MEELRANNNDNDNNNNNKAVIPKLPPQSTYPRLAIHAPASAAVTPYVVDAPNERNKKHLTGLANDLDSMSARREELKHAFVRKTMKRQDVDGDDIRPLVEIAYWSPFLEVRRDAAAALASLSRNTANLEILSEVGALGALISMLSSYQDRLDASIARDCAQALASMVRLPSVKTKILQAPDGMDCIFSMLHVTDLKLRCIACEIIMNLVTIDELREVVAKREGFAFMLTSCTSKDSRIRCLAAAILHQLAACRDNRFLFYHSTTHFETLALILCDPYMEKDFRFRRELLSFVHLLVSEEENGRRFVELNLVSTLLLFLDSPKTNLQICLLVVSIIEALSLHKRNHVALVAANALPRIVQFCFSANRGLPSGLGSHKPNGFLPEHRPSSAAASRRSAISQSGPGLQASAGMIAGMAASFIPRPHSSCTLPVPSEMSAILRPAFVVFCEMAKNPTNREHVIRSKLIDYIASKNLYASPDKRLRRSVITLLTFLICKERERDRQREQQQSNSVLIHSDTVKLELDEQPKTAAEKKQERDTTEEAEYKHYIELLARGVVKCLFGILHGNDFSMKVDAIGAIAQLTEDESSRITMCKPQLLQALKEFAFHPLVQTRYNIARTIANFAERPENILKLVDEGVLAILVKYVCPISRNNEVLYEATRAIAAMSMVHVSRNKLVECGVLGTLIQFCKASNTSTRVCEHALTAIRNLRHDAAALRIQSIYRGWAVRAQFARNIFNRRKRLRKMTSLRKLQTDSSLVTVMERLVTS
uniref:Vacuolar protein 8 n=1 Tax=Globisporangium ultimum (strain ATCC 200006 / CBS 805.95 / DAOM BR144) TaxID=431595 RepID=K3X490_GLOUD